MSQILAMAKRLQDAEATIAKFNRDGLENVRTSDESESLATSGLASSTRSNTPKPAAAESNDILGGFDEPPPSIVAPEKASVEDTPLSDLSLDEHGKASSHHFTMSRADNPDLLLWPDFSCP